MRLDKDPKSPLHNWNDSELDEEAFFPWEDVFKCKIIPNEGELKPCPECIKENTEGDKEGHLITVYFKSPAWTWERLCGREGYLTICTKHKIQVDFICTVMN